MVDSAQYIRGIIKDKIPTNLVVPEHTENQHYYRHTKVNELYASVTTKCGVLDHGPHIKMWAARLAVEHITKHRHLMNDGADAEQRDLMLKQAVLLHQDTFQEAGNIGTRGHRVVEDYLTQWIETGIRPADIRSFVNDHDPRVTAIARSAELFCTEYNAVPVVSELLVASTKHKFAGTLDALMMILKTATKGDGSCERDHDFLPLSRRHPNKVKCLRCGLTGSYIFTLVDWKSSNSIDKIEYAMQVSAYREAIKEMTGLVTKQIYIVRLDKTQAKYEIRTVPDPKSAFVAFTHASKVWDWMNDGDEKLDVFPKKERVSLASLSLNPV